jgi:truncated hemoglobin YjbI
MGASNLYETLGGTAACRRLAVAFYGRVERDPILRPLFPGKTFKCAIEEFTAFLAQFLGGPSEDSQRRWWLSLHESHRRFKIGQRERTAWIANMLLALDDVRIQEPLRSELLGFFQGSSAYVVNQGEPTAAEDAGGGKRQVEIARRWKAQLRLDEAVAALRSGDAKRAIALAESSTLETCGRTVHCGLLALMIRSRQSELLDHARVKLAGDPALAQERYAGRTLLHEAAAAGEPAMVELLLSLGADPNALDGGGHTPLYSAGNECAVEGGGKVVRALVRGGADVNACEGVKRCTALHMAARRGHAEVAAALLDCGADLEVRDSHGETPLRRAVNCEKPALVSLLIERGADLRSKAKNGTMPVLAARSPAMKRLLKSATKEQEPRWMLQS